MAAGKLLLLAGLALLVFTGYQAMTCESTRLRASSTSNGNVAAGCPAPLAARPALLLARHPARHRLPPSLLLTSADRENLRLTQQQFEGLPLALMAQLAAAVAVCVLGGLEVSGGFKPIRVADVPK
jgi:hypothetical protein